MLTPWFYSCETLNRRPTWTTPHPDFWPKSSELMNVVLCCSIFWWFVMAAIENKYLVLCHFCLHYFIQFSSVAQWCPTLCDHMNCSMPSLPVHHQLPESTQSHVHWVGDAIQPFILCCPLLLLPSIFPIIGVFSNYTHTQKKTHHDPDNHDDVITHLEPDILECKVKRALGSITMNKAGGGDGISAELFEILKDDAVKVLQSTRQQIWKTQQWPQDWKRSVFIPISRKGNAKECSNYLTIAFILHASKVMLKILQERLQQYVTWEFPDV